MKSKKNNVWNPVKVSDDIIFEQGGFFRLEELNFTGDINSPEFKKSILSDYSVSNIEETHVIDTNYDEFKDEFNEDTNKKTKLKKLSLKVNNKKVDLVINQVTQDKKSNKMIDTTKTNLEESGAKITQEISKKKSRNKFLNNMGENKQTSKTKINEKNDVLHNLTKQGKNKDEKLDEIENLESEKSRIEQINFENDQNVENDQNQTEQEQKINDYDDPVSLTSWNDIYPIHKLLLLQLNNMNFKEPTNIQKSVLVPALLKRNDIIGSSQTGTGKTLAFGLPILHQILELKEKEKEKGKEPDLSIKALILTPTRELAIQIADHLKEVSNGCFIKIASIVGGIAIPKQQRILSRHPDILIATPGRLWEIISTGIMSSVNTSFINLRYLVFDEADKMVELGRYKEMSNILRSLYDSTSKSTQKKPIQTFIFSATMSVGEQTRKNLKSRKNPKLANSEKQTKNGDDNSDLSNHQLMFEKLIEQIQFFRPVEFIDITTFDHHIESMQEAKILCIKEQKDIYLYYFLCIYPGRTLIFVNSISNIKRIVPLLNILNVPVWGIHANMQQRQRLKNLERFRSQSNSVLVATDIMSRGLDIPLIDHVIHYQIPVSAEVFIHRSGRTARAFSNGLTLSIVDPDDKKNYTSILKTLKRPEVPDFPVELSYLKEIKSRIKLAMQINNLQHLSSKENSFKSWVIRTANEVDTDIPYEMLSESENEESMKKKSFEKEKNALKYKALKNQLSALLEKPLLPKGTSVKFITREPETIKIIQNNLEQKSEKKRKASYSQEPHSKKQKSASTNKKYISPLENIPTNQESDTINRKPHESAFVAVSKIKNRPNNSMSTKLLEKAQRKLRRGRLISIRGPISKSDEK